MNAVCESVLVEDLRTEEVASTRILDFEHKSGSSKKRHIRGFTTTSVLTGSRSDRRQVMGL